MRLLNLARDLALGYCVGQIVRAWLDPAGHDAARDLTEKRLAVLLDAWQGRA